MTNLQQIIKEKEEYFEKEFIAAGADIEGMTRVEYRQLRENQVETLKHFIFSDYTKSILAGVREIVEGMRDNRDMQSMFFSKEDRLRRDVNNQAFSNLSATLSALEETLINKE